MSVIDELLQANERLADALGQAERRPSPPRRRVAIVICMDARIMPARVLGLEEGDAHVIRNAGGLARDALRSLVISQRLLGTNAIAVVHHTDCGMQTFRNEDVYAKVRDDLDADAGEIDFMPFGDLEGSVRDDLDFLARSPLIAPDTEIRGFVYDVGSRRLTEVS